jgi:hypothetical protein
MSIAERGGEKEDKHRVSYYIKQNEHCEIFLTKMKSGIYLVEFPEKTQHENKNCREIMTTVRKCMREG